MTENNKSSIAAIIVILFLFSIVSNSTFSGNLSIPSHNFLMQPAIGQVFEFTQDDYFDSDDSLGSTSTGEGGDNQDKDLMNSNGEGNEQEQSGVDDYLLESSKPEINTHSGISKISPVEPSSPNTVPSPFTQFEPENQQHGGAATSGDATGGAANAEAMSGGCYQCHVYNYLQATGGQAASGAATGGAATAEEYLQSQKNDSDDKEED